LLVEDETMVACGRGRRALTRQGYLRLTPMKARKLWACSPFRPTRNSSRPDCSDVVDAEYGWPDDGETLSAKIILTFRSCFMSGYAESNCASRIDLDRSIFCPKPFSVAQIA